MGVLASAIAILALAAVDAPAAIRNVGPGQTYTTIQSAINAAGNGDTIQVAAGTYMETLTWNTKDLQLIGAGAGVCVIDASDAFVGSCLRMTGVPGTSRVEGFTFTNGNMPYIYPSAGYGGGIYCNSSSPTITGNTITGNFADIGGGIYCYQSSPTITGNIIDGNTGTGGAGICCEGSSPTIANNTISGNVATSVGGGIYVIGGSPIIDNCTISGNGADFAGGIYGHDSSLTTTNTIIAFTTEGGGFRVSGVGFTVEYCNVYGNIAFDTTVTNYSGMLDPTGSSGNISVDPLFADAGAGDFHLKSKGGRWAGAAWTLDAVHSPCIDTGKPASPFGNELAPNGGRVNMGAWGNTDEASKWANRPPSVASVEIAPDPAVTGDSLTGTPSGWSDPDGDTAGYDWQWEKDTGGGLAVITGQTNDTLGSANFAKGDVVRVTCTPDDGTDQGAPVTDAVTIGNTPPTQPTVDVTPDSPDTRDDLQVAASGSTDADGDTVIYHYAWYKDSAHQAAYDDQTTLSAIATARGQVWRCVVTPTDGTDDGPPDEDQVTLGNAPPTLASVDISPDPARTADDLIAAPSGGNDADGDAVTYEYQWAKWNSGTSSWDDLFGATGDTLASSNFVRGDLLRVTCWPVDGGAQGTPVTAEATIQN